MPMQHTLIISRVFQIFQLPNVSLYEMAYDTWYIDSKFHALTFVIILDPIGPIDTSACQTYAKEIYPCD